MSRAPTRAPSPASPDAVDPMVIGAAMAEHARVARAKDAYHAERAEAFRAEQEAEHQAMVDEIAAELREREHQQAASTAPSTDVDVDMSDLPGPEVLGEREWAREFEKRLDAAVWNDAIEERRTEVAAKGFADKAREPVRRTVAPAVSRQVEGVDEDEAPAVEWGVGLIAQAFREGE